MKNIKLFKLRNTIIAGLLLVITYGCDRDLTDDIVDATFPSTADVFIDNPVGLTDEFFESFDPAEGYNTEDTFEVVDDEAYEGTSSIRIDVPSPDNPNGFLAGGIFRDRGTGRDLTSYDALTFWAKATTTATLASVGFGADFDEDKFTVVRSDVQLNTNWTKYIIPIPDASKLVQERGLFSFIAAPFDVLGDGPNGNEIGWTLWIDEIRYEALGTLGQSRPRIYNGADLVEETFTGSSFQVTPLTYTANLPTGIDATVTPAFSYFTFESSNPSVASVSESGEVFVLGDGTATITATLANNQAEGSLQINAAGAFVNAPDPTEPAANVISIYSDSYTGVNGLNVGAFNNADINIQTQTFDSNGHIVYENLEFVGMSWDGTIDVSGMTHVHLDVQLTSPGSTLIVELIDFGPDNTDNGLVGTDGSAGGFNATSQLMEGDWVGIDIPLNAFTLPTGGGGAGNPNLNNMGYVVLVSNGGSVLVDNVYFYNQ
ncbi:Ig-like domain-containing protein [uncultured Winogradskyella sp.]|uniref:Ig-like domain-containing protein n=1 Tax=uncultured Winogradskyella sp. TaxID=395353 RepID=UPI00261E413D|nr:Ig-like domain-containing protein [uncultured Winogradskyella sp.]